MKERKLKGYVLPTLYVLTVGLFFITITILGNVLNTNISYGNMSISAITDNSFPVIKDEEIVKGVNKPFNSDKVTKSKSFYDMTDDEETQQNSLVYFEKTYLQNSGILYSSDEAFDILAAYDGTITNVAKDEILGNYIEITHNTDLRTVYYSLSDLTVKKGDKVNAGDVIGKSGDNKLDNEKDNCLLFEVYHNGYAINPENFYNMDSELLD